MKRALLTPYLFVAALAAAQSPEIDFTRADGLAARFADKVYRLNVSPQWMEGGAWLWYRVNTGPGEFGFVTVDARSGERRTAFDHQALAEAIGRTTGEAQNPSDLRLRILGRGPAGLQIAAAGRRFQWDDRSRLLTALEGPGEPGSAGTLRAFLPERPSAGGGEETYLTLENRSAEPVDVVWVNNEGQRVRYHTLRPGESRFQRTFVGHVWVFTDADGKALAAYEATESPGWAVFDGTSPEPRQPRTGPPVLLAPKGGVRATVRDGNVWIQRPDAEFVAATVDGKAGDAYDPGSLVWSPDGRYLAAERVEAGDDRKVTIVRSSPPDQLQPTLLVFPYLKPGDDIPHPRVVVIDVSTGAVTAVDERLSPNPWDFTWFAWSADSKELYYVYNQRGHQVLRLIAADPATGHVRTVTEDVSRTFLDYANKRWVQYLPETGEAVWMSERSGWNHLYRIDLRSGQVKNAVTSGEWLVRQVERFDPQAGVLYLRVMGVRPGEDPYHVHLARVGLDGKGFRLLTEGDGLHRFDWAPDGETFVATFSRVDRPPVTELRRARDGRRLALLETADATALRSAGWVEPERFVAKGRDGRTDVHGVIFRPTDFDPSKRYPVVENIYAGPHGAFVPKSFAPYHGSMRLAELGFIVVQIDGMGTNWRSKAFHDVAWRNLADSGFPDRIAWMRAAAATRPWMDLERVGIYGTSAGGQSAASAVMRFGDFYRAAVADCGCHDNRMDKIWWNELWMGYPIGPWYAENSNVTAAKDLKGALFLMVGEVDTNVDPASTMQVVNALIAAGKRFDLLVMPNVGHGCLGLPYAWRRMAEFFVRELGKPK